VTTSTGDEAAIRPVSTHDRSTTIARSCDLAGPLRHGRTGLVGARPWVPGRLASPNCGADVLSSMPVESP
jgi:hypothetical protein